MGQLPPSAFFVIIQQTKANHHVGMLMCAALGLPAEMPICSGSQLAMRGENDALTPGPCQSEGVTGGWTAVADHQRALFWPLSASGLLGGNVILHHMFSLWHRMSTLVYFEPAEPDMGQIDFAKECLFSVWPTWRSWFSLWFATTVDCMYFCAIYTLHLHASHIGA